MKSLRLIVTLFLCLLGLETVIASADDNADDKFAGWTEEQYRKYEDSIRAALYPPVILHCNDNPSPLVGDANRQKIIKVNNHVPPTVAIDKTKAVGQIPIESGMSFGAKTYNVPIEVYPGIRDFHPNLSLTYNSYLGNSATGTGWSLSGIPAIVRGCKSVCHDGKAEGIVRNNTDPFTLDGMRLIKISTATDYILYESERGKIKVKGYIDGGIMKYFEVFYPDGNKGIFGFTSNTYNRMQYPVTSLKDAMGNTINYAYTFADNNYDIKKISYNGSSVDFEYINRPDTIISFVGGMKVCKTKLLRSITPYFNNKALRVYQLDYTVSNSRSFLSRIDCLAGGESFNPLLFYYGSGSSDKFYSLSTTGLIEWYISKDPNRIRITKGKFDYDSGADGIIMLPNEFPYWKHYRSSNLFRHSQNRLTTHSNNSVTYDIKGNITEKSDVGSFDYSIADRPYAISKADLTGNAMATCSQEIAYTSFSRPDSIVENGYKAKFVYNDDFDRVRMTVSLNDSVFLKRYYLGGCYEIDRRSGNIMEKLYLCGDYYDSPVAFVKNNGTRQIVHILRDYMGSITHLYLNTGQKIQEISYDAWGRLRDPATLRVYDHDEQPALSLGRGYTGHEHLPWFGLINMNSRLYDPALGRFLSPDPYVQMPDFSQNFNRYSYALNNPLRFVDEDGEFFWAVVGIAAAVSAVVNVATHWKEIKSAGGWNSFWKGAGYALTGALAGGAGAAAGFAAAATFGGMAGINATGFIQGALTGAVNGATSGFISETSNSLIVGSSLGSALSNGFFASANDAVFGGLMGGTIGGIKAIRHERNFWTGKMSNRTLVQNVANIAEKNIAESGHVGGTKKHKYAGDMIKRYEKLNKKNIGVLNLKIEEGTKFGDKIYKPDVIDLKNNIIYDWKFGYPNKTPAQLNLTPQMMNYRREFKMPTVIIKPILRPRL